MAIEFPCKHCQSTLRVPDENQGMMARCPSCQSIVSIPGEAQSSNDDSNSGSSFSPDAKEDIFPEDDGKPFYIGPGAQANRPQGTSNPFAGPSGTAPSNPLSDYANPYQATAAAPRTNPGAHRQLRGKIIGAGIGMLIVSIPGFIYSIGLAFSTLAGVLEGFGDFDQFLFSFIFLVVQGFAFVGAISMLRVRNRRLAIIGSVCQLFGGICCLCIPSVVAIFALMVLNETDADLVMQSHSNT